MRLQGDFSMVGFLKLTYLYHIYMNNCRTLITESFETENIIDSEQELQSLSDRQSLPKDPLKNPSAPSKCKMVTLVTNVTYRFLSQLYSEQKYLQAIAIHP